MPTREELLLASVMERITLVAKHVARIRRLPASMDEGDLVSVGLAAAWRAAGRYRADTGATFWTYAEHRVRGAMLDECREMHFGPQRTERWKHVAPPCALVPLEQAMECPDPGADLDVPLQRAQEWEVLLSNPALREKERAIIRKLVAGVPAKDIGKAWGISASRISQHLRRGLDVLRRDRHAFV